MLSADEIITHLQKSGDAALSIIPEPDLTEMKARAGTSIDLRLGRWFRSFKQTHTSSYSLAPTSTALGPGARLTGLPTKQHFIQFGKRFVIHPGSFVLGATLEWLTVPKSLSAYVTGKSTLGRHGLIIETAAGIHPGFSGCLTLELGNVGEIPLEIYPGMSICQVFFHALVQQSTVNTGIASGSRKPVLPMLSPDIVFERLKGGVGTPQLDEDSPA